MSDVSIREVLEAGLAPFFELMGEVEGGSHFDPANLDHVDWLTDRINKHYGHGVRFFGMWEGDDPVGIVGLLVERHLQTEWQLGYITDLRVYPRFRGKGYGSKLMDFVAEEAKRQNCYCVHVDTYAGSAYNVVFYTRNGYAPVGVIADMNGPGDEGQVWLRKVLGQGKSNGQKIGSRSTTGDSP
jgi:GNAT superfamily N-acetyltransferase